MDYKQYKVFDLATKTTVGTYDTVKETFQNYRKFQSENRGKCDLVIMKWNPKVGVYQIL